MKPEFRMMNSVPNARFWHWYRDESIVEGTTPSPPLHLQLRKKASCFLLRRMVKFFLTCQSSKCAYFWQVRTLTPNSLSSPKSPSCLQDPGFSAVCEKKSVMVNKRSWFFLAIASLPVALQKHRHGLDCFVGPAAPLQTQSETQNLAVMNSLELAFKDLTIGWN